MKKQFFKFIPIVFGAMIAFTSCSDDDGDDEMTPANERPTVSVNINNSVDQSDYNVMLGDTIFIAITAQKVGRDLDEIKVVQNGDNAITTGVGFNFTSTSETYNLENNIALSIANADDETMVIRDTLTNITSTVGTTSYTFSVTDRGGKTGTRTFDINVAAPAVPFTETKTGKIWHIQSSLPGSWSFTTDTTVTRAASANDADFRNTTSAGGPITGDFRVGTNRTNTNFVIADANFDYDNATLTSATDAYNQGTPDADDADLAAVGSVYIYNVNGNYVAVKVTDINTSDQTASTTNTGFIEFEYKK